MIARYWSARLSARNLASYREHLERNVFPELQSIPGFIRAELLTHTSGSEVDVVVLSVWNSFEAIDSFAGPDRESAVVAPSAAALLTSYDRRVRHFEIAAST